MRLEKFKKLISIIIVVALLLIGYVTFSNNNKNPTSNDKINNILSKETGTVVLNYHEIGNNKFTEKIYNDVNVYNLSLDDFESHIQYIIENDINVITLDELNNEIKSNIFLEKNIVITFDDVDESVYGNAYPILKENNIPFAIFIVTSKPGTSYDERDFASWDQIKEMQQSGLATVGLHTNDMHYKENGEPVFLNEESIDAFEKDLLESMNIFEEQLGYMPTYFAYPYGFGTPQTDEVLMENGVELIFSLNPDVVDDETVNFYVPRLLITKDNQEYVASWLEN